MHKSFNFQKLKLKEKQSKKRQQDFYFKVYWNKYIQNVNITQQLNSCAQDKMSESFYKRMCGRIINIAPISCKQHQRLFMFQYLRMLILTIIYLAILVRNFISKKYNVSDYQNYLLLTAPGLLFANWVCDRFFLSKKFDIDFSPLIILYFIIPYVAICRNGWQSDTLSYSILMIWSINIVFSRSQIASFLGCAIGFFALIYQGWDYNYQEIIVGVGILSCFLNWELNKQNIYQKSFIQQISKKVEAKYLKNQKQIKMIVEVDKNYNPTNQKTNDIKLIYISSNQYNEQFFGSTDPIPFIRNCWVSSKKKKSFLQQLITSQLESKNQVSSTFKVRYVKGIKPVMINASLTEQEELEIIQLGLTQENQMQKQNNQTQSASKSEMNLSNTLSISSNQTIKFTFLINQEIEERQYWKFCQKFQQKLLQNILRKSMVNMQKIVNILSPNLRRNKGWTLLETKQIINKLRYITTVMQQDFYNLYDFQKQNYETAHSDFYIKKVIKETIDMYAELSQEKHVNLLFIDKAPELKKIKNDEKRILQILMILLENSISNTQENGSILVKLKCSDITSPYATLEVVDNGKGILNTFQPPYPHPKTLQQAQHNAQSPVQIGLYNLKQILSKIGPQQDIILKSTKDVGTKISFNIYRDLDYKDSVYWGKHGDKNRYSIPILPPVEDNGFAARTDNKYSSMIPIQNDNQIQEESQQLSDESIYADNKQKQKSQIKQSNQIQEKDVTTSRYYLQQSKTEESPNGANVQNNDKQPAAAIGDHNIHNNSFSNIKLEDTFMKSKSNYGSKANISIINYLHNSIQMIQVGNQDINKESIQIKCVSIQDGQQQHSPSKQNVANPETPLNNSNNSNPNNNNNNQEKAQKSILKRPKMLVQQSENFINLNKIIKNDEFEQDSDLDSDIHAIEIEEFPNHSPGKPEPFEYIKRTQKEKRLSHLSDISRFMTPQNMPSTNAFSNSRFGYDTSPKHLINRNMGRNSTLNFSEIDKDF
ncbi:hypothetical protein ABPG72_006639 [Tetrahymena utriculariae]